MVVAQVMMVVLPEGKRLDEGLASISLPWSLCLGTMRRRGASCTATRR